MRTVVVPVSDTDVLRAHAVLRRHGVPVLGDVRLVSVGALRLEVWIQVNDRWRIAISGYNDNRHTTISHFVAADGAKPLAWPLVPDQDDAIGWLDAEDQ